MFLLVCFDFRGKHDQKFTFHLAVNTPPFQFEDHSSIAVQRNNLWGQDKGKIVPFS
jgi:hypothetical protein